jgi:hypothetical protein
VVRPYFLLLAAVLALPAQAYEFLKGYDTAPTVAAALERVKAEPKRHVLLYFGMSENCPPCEDARALLNSPYVRDKWAPNYIVVQIDLFKPTAEELKVIQEVRVSWAPVLVFLAPNGSRVAYSRQLRAEGEAMRLNEYVSTYQYALPGLSKVIAGDYGRIGRITAPSDRIDDRPRVKDVLGQEHKRLSREELEKLLPDKRMHKENQDWFLTMDFKGRKLLDVEGRRKDGRSEMRGAGKWYVTKKGKLCVELDTRGVDENWCRHVFLTGAGAYYVSKDLRPSRPAHRFTLK